MKRAWALDWLEAGAEDRHVSPYHRRTVEDPQAAYLSNLRYYVQSSRAEPTSGAQLKALGSFPTEALGTFVDETLTRSQIELIGTVLARQVRALESAFQQKTEALESRLSLLEAVVAPELSRGPAASEVDWEAAESALRQALSEFEWRPVAVLIDKQAPRMSIVLPTDQEGLLVEQSLSLYERLAELMPNEFETIAFDLSVEDDEDDLDPEG